MKCQHLLFVSFIFLFISCSADKDPIVFTVIGDVPYSDAERTLLPQKIEAHNAEASSSFVVHVGDIKRGSDPCDVEVYEDVSAMLRKFTVPSFMLIGDNEFNDCEDPVQARAFWDQHFLDFHTEWSFDHDVATQDVRKENWAWTQDGVLFIGLNIVGSVRHDTQEWEERLAHNVVWLDEQFAKHTDEVYAAVVFGHANMVDFGSGKFQVIIDALVAEASAFDKPMAYVQGDGHQWIDDVPWEADNLRRIQIDGGTTFVTVTVDQTAPDVIRFDSQ